MPISEAAVSPPRQWDVVVLPFPYSDRLAEKRRPSVVVSKPEVTETYGIVWVAMITSARNAGWRCDVDIRDLEGTGLSHTSVIRPVKLATVDARRIIRVAGAIGLREQAAVSQVLAEAFT